jgi:hypothetical protein
MKTTTILLLVGAGAAGLYFWTKKQGDAAAAPSDPGSRVALPNVGTTSGGAGFPSYDDPGAWDPAWDSFAPSGPATPQGAAAQATQEAKQANAPFGAAAPKTYARTPVAAAGTPGSAEWRAALGRQETKKLDASTGGFAPAKIITTARPRRPTPRQVGRR